MDLSNWASSAISNDLRRMNLQKAFASQEVAKAVEQLSLDLEDRADLRVAQAERAVRQHRLQTSVDRLARAVDLNGRRLQGVFRSAQLKKPLSLGASLSESVGRPIPVLGSVFGLLLLVVAMIRRSAKYDGWLGVLE